MCFKKLVCFFFWGGVEGETKDGRMVLLKIEKVIGVFFFFGLHANLPSADKPHRSLEAGPLRHLSQEGCRKVIPG